MLGKIGPDFCKYYSDLWTKVPPLVFKENAESGNSGSFHFILILDDSGSMSGQRFNLAKDGASKFLVKLKEIEGTLPKLTVTIIIFNSSARCVEERQKVKPVEQSNKIVYNGGGTEFGQPLDLSFKIAQKDVDFDK